MVVVLRTNLNQVVDRLDRRIINLSRQAPLIGEDFCNEVKRKIRLQLTFNRTIWRGKTWNSVRVVKENKSRFNVSMAKEGVWLDSMEPHYVKLKKGRLIRQWALTKGNEKIQAVAKRQGSIFVRPHPFIDESIAKALTRLNAIISKRMIKGLEAK